MGWNQPKESEGKRDEAMGNARMNPQNLKDRASASFQGRQAVNPASGTGSKGNPGKPV